MNLEEVLALAKVKAKDGDIKVGKAVKVKKMRFSIVAESLKKNTHDYN